MNAPPGGADRAIRDVLDAEGRAIRREEATGAENGFDSPEDGGHSVDVLLERYLGSISDPRAAYKELAGWMKAQMTAGRWDRLAEAIPRFVVPGLDYTSAISLHRILGKVSKEARAPDREARIAVLGSFTTHQLVSLVELYLCRGKVKAEIYEADYGTFRQELLDPESDLYRFRPDFIVLATSWRDLGHRPELGDDRAGGGPEGRGGGGGGLGAPVADGARAARMPGHPE